MAQLWILLANYFMFAKFFFERLSISEKIDYLKDKGTLVGSRVRDSRQIFLYMVKDFFVEVMFENDQPQHAAEQIKVFSNLQNLNGYLESEARKSGS